MLVASMETTKIVYVHIPIFGVLWSSRRPLDCVMHAAFGISELEPWRSDFSLPWSSVCVGVSKKAGAPNTDPYPIGSKVPKYGVSRGLLYQDS